MREFDVIIVGAGVTGAVLAGLLIERGCCTAGRVALLADRFMPPLAADADWDPRVFALSRFSEQVLKSCGVWQLLPRDRLQAYERMQVWDADDGVYGPRSVRFDCAEIGEPNLGYIADGRVLQWHALQVARASGVVTIEAEVKDIVRDVDAASVTLHDGRRLCAPLVVGADGVQSQTRRLLGIGTAGHAYHQDALVAHVRTEKSHQDTAWQRFLPGGPLALLPLSDGRCSLVWSAERGEASRLRALETGAFDAALTTASDEVLGRCSLTTDLTVFPLRMQYALAYVQPRAALVGDAAHTVHPLAGQGLNLGLMDCEALVQELAECGDARGFGDMQCLRRYERARRSENFLAAAALDGLERIFAARGPLGSAARALGLRAVNGSPAIKRRLARIALGGRATGRRASPHK